MNDSVYALEVLPDGDLAVGGFFITAGGNVSAYFARYTFGGSCCGSADFNGDGDTGTDLDIEAFFSCLGGACCPACGSADFNSDGDTGTDLDIEAFFRVLGGGPC
mgnify:CR=1 FL=1